MSSLRTGSPLCSLGKFMEPTECCKAYLKPEEEIYKVDIDSLDLKYYANNYSGLALIYRLIYIADHCPKLRSDALQMALSYVIKTMNVKMYEILHQKLLQNQENVLPDATGANPVDLGLPIFNADWVELTTQKAAMEFKKLNADLRSFMISSLKERIRYGYNGIGDHYVDCGNLIEAINMYWETRDYCSKHSHVILMYLNVIKVGIYLHNWPQVLNYVREAEYSLQNTEASVLETYNSALKCMSGLAKLAYRKYEEVAQNFILMDLDHWYSINDLILPNDVAIYGGLCALATFERSKLKKYVIHNILFNPFLELEPEIRDVIFKFYETKYEVCFTILDKIKPKLLLDIYIGPHINHLYLNIRRKAMIQYFYPYDSADLRKMALCFNTPLPDLEDEIMHLILDGHINARIDSINKILYRKHPDPRVETINNALTMAHQFYRLMHISVLRNQMVKKWLPKPLKENMLIKIVKYDFIQQ